MKRVSFTKDDILAAIIEMLNDEYVKGVVIEE